MDDEFNTKSRRAWGQGAPEECKVLARVVGVGAGCVVSASLVEILHREIRRVCDGPEARHERGIDLPYRAPIYAIEKGVVFDLLDVQSPIRTGYEPVIYEGGARREEGRGKQGKDSELGGIGAIAKVGWLLTGESCLRLRDSSGHPQELRGGTASG